MSTLSVKLKICEFNVENLFVSMEYYRGQDLERMDERTWREQALAQLQLKQKPLTKLWGLAKAIQDIQPDILMLIEVGGRDSLENFNRYFLGDQYVPYFIEGNSRRNIDLAFLVAKKLPFQVESRTNRDLPVEVHAYQGKYSARLSRDIAELRIHDERGMRLILLLTHLKSKISTDQDHQGKNVRSAEAAALARYYESLRQSLPDTPIIVGGDFNADLASLDLELIARTDLTDFHDLLDTPHEDRLTLVHFDYFGRPRPQRLDYLLVAPSLCKQVVREESYTYRYKSFFNVPDPIPNTPSERSLLPSDHYPLVLTVRI